MPSAASLYYDIREGDIMKAKPKHFLPRPEGVGSIGQHPVIVLSRPDAYGYVFVTPMSHSHPDGTPTRTASQYGLPVDPVKGESRVNIGMPKCIHRDNLKANNPHVAMSWVNFVSLRNDIRILSNTILKDSLRFTEPLAVDQRRTYAFRI